jgi:endoglucanase
MKNFKILLFIIIGLMSLDAFAWPGMDLPPLHVEGRNLQDPCGNNVILHGVAMTPSPWFNGGALGIWRWNDYDVQGCLDYNKAVMNKLTTTSDGWHLNYVRLHIDPYWTNDPGDPIPENNISRFNYDRLVQYTDEVIIPLINHAKERGMYVILRPPGVCPERIAVNDYYHEYLKTVWRFLSQHPGLRNADNVMFELANEPVEIMGTDGSWGKTGQTHFDALKNFFQPLVNIIRNNGANNICWIPGSGWQSHYAGYANNPVTGGNIGYAVHIYPGYWGGVRNYQAFQTAWDQNVKPVADFAPIVVTETDWAPDQYDTFGTATTGTAEGDGFGANLNHITYNSGNVSWNVLCPENLIHQGDPNGGTAYDGNWQACAAPVKHWFSEFASSNVPSSSCGSGNIPDGTYSLTNRNSGQSLDCYNLGTSDGTNVVQWPGTGQTNQQWNITSTNDGFYRISPVHAPSKGLDVSDFSSEDGANIQLWEYWGGECQQWKINDTGDGYYQIEARHSGKLLEVVGASSENGANAQQWSSNNHPCQHWALQPLLKNASSGINQEKDNPFDSFVVFPNPSNGQFNIRIPKNLEEENLDILMYDMSGKVVYSTTSGSQKKISIITNLNQGLYILKVNTKNQEFVRKIKIE